MGRFQVELHGDGGQGERYRGGSLSQGQFTGGS